MTALPHRPLPTRIRPGHAPRPVPLRALLVLLLLLPPLAGPLRAAEGDEALRERAREIRLVVESITGIPFPRPVEIRIIGKPEVRPFFEEEIARELPTGKIDFLQRSFIRLGMAEPDFDLEEAFLDLVSSQVAGFYHSREEVLYLIRGMAAQEMILAHELTHALQDQIDDLDGTADALDDEHRDDALAAYQALYEGEAMIVMAQHFAKTMDAGSVQDVLGMLAESGAQSAVLERAPLFLRESLIFPYTYGQTFATRAFNGGTGFGPLRRLFRDPPASTEQILHPYKYYDTRDRPTRLALRDLAGALGPRWRRLGRSELGEAGAGWLLRHHGVGQLEAMRAARGWDGDAFVLLAEAPGPEKGEAIREGLIWVSTWDSAAHAHRFRKAFEAALTETHGRPDAHLAGGGAHWTRPGDTAILLRRWGREVVFLNGFREPELTALRARLTRLKTSGALFAEDHRDDAAPPPAGDE